MNKRIIFALLALVTMWAQALEVNNAAGSLASKVTNLDITSLKVNGTMNADDFYFIADNLLQLTTLDLENVTIEACHTSNRHYWQWDFEADVVPVGSFADLAVTQVALPASARAIGQAAFAGCSQLSSVKWPSALDSIADFAFAGCTSLTAVELPASVQVVGYGAFMRCTALTSFTVQPASRLRRLDATALMDCQALNTLSLGGTLQSMGERVLAGSGLQSLDLTANSSLTDVGDWAMVQTPVTAAKLPSSLIRLGDGAFLYAADLASISLGERQDRINDFVLAGTGLAGNLSLDGIISLGNYALYNVSLLSVVELPETMTWLGTRSMAGMIGLQKLTSNAEEVPALGDEVWAGVNQSAIPLTVPTGSINLYKAAEQWKEFMFDSGWLKGDVNGDGEVNIADINAVVNIILGHVYDDLFMRRADVNEDGEINIADVNLVLALIMSSSHKASMAPDTEDQLHLDDVQMRPGEVRTLLVTLDNAASYSALQCDITLPQGLSLVESRCGQEYVIQTQGLGDATARAVLYSSECIGFDGDDTAVLAITVRADDALASEADIILTNIVIADGDNTGWHVADCTARVANSTGIDDLTATVARVWVEGRTLCIDTSRPGNAQVIAINGTSHETTLEIGVNRQELDKGFYVVTLEGRSYKIVIK